MSNAEPRYDSNESRSGAISPPKSIPQERGAMPASVIVAAAAIGIIVIVNALATIGAFVRPSSYFAKASLISLCLSCLIFAGIIARHRLAWQWGRLLTILGAIFPTVWTVLFLTVAEKEPGMPSNTAIIVTYLIYIGPLYVIFISLGRLGARKYFRLTCPQCGKLTNKAADFLFNKARCKSCGTIWR